MYNRWGSVVWQSNDPADRWDGGDTFAYVPNGVYTWTIKAQPLDQQSYFDSGVCNAYSLILSMRL